ncbi:MAG: DsbA family protein [Streptosporangiales bacterium]
MPGLQPFGGPAVSKSGRTAARERIRLERERAARRQRRNRALLIIGGALAVIVIAIVVIVVARPGQSKSAAVHGAYYTGPFPPVTLNSDHSVTAAKPGVSTPVLDIYEDFQCPICDAFEKANGGMVQKLAAEGKVRVVYHPFTIFLGEQPQQDNSVRAWAAAWCVPAGRWLLYHNLLYANQQPETTPGGFPVSQLLALGRRAGLTSPSFTSCVSSQRYAPEAVPLSEQIIKSGITGTPTVQLNGHPISNSVLVVPGTALEKMILAAH